MKNTEWFLLRVFCRRESDKVTATRRKEGRKGRHSNGLLYTLAYTIAIRPRAVFIHGESRCLVLGTRTPLIGTSVLVNVWDFRRGKGGARAVVVSHRIFRWKVWNFDNTFEKGDVSFRSFGKFSWRADVFTWTFLRIGKPFLPGDSWGNLSVWFSDYGRGGDRMDGKWQRPPRKFTIISTECTRMRARGEEGGREWEGEDEGDRETLSRRFQIILASSRYDSSLSLRAKTTLFPRHF